MNFTQYWNRRREKKEENGINVIWIESIWSEWRNLFSAQISFECWIICIFFNSVTDFGFHLGSSLNPIDRWLSRTAISLFTLLPLVLLIWMVIMSPWLGIEEKSVISKSIFMARSINVRLENEWSSAFYSPIKIDKRQTNAVKKESQYKYILGHRPYAFDYHFSCKSKTKNWNPRISNHFIYCLKSEIRTFVHVEN